MKFRDTHSLLLLLTMLTLSGCGDDSDDSGTLNINEIVKNVEAVSGDGSGDGSGGGGVGGGFGGTTIGECTRITTIASDSITTGELNSNSCELIDFSLDQLNGTEAADGYVVVLPSDGTLTALMSSEDFDAYLFLYLCNDDSCSTAGFLSQNDDGSGGGLNAEISIDLLEGTYLILAAELNASEPDGDYTLVTSFVSSSATL